MKNTQLLKGEFILSKANLHWITFIPSIIIMYISLIAFLITKIHYILLSPIIIIIPSLLQYLLSNIAITNKRIIGSTGTIKRKIISIPLEKIKSIVVHESNFEKKIGCATLVISSYSDSYTIAYIVKKDFFQKELMEALGIDGK